LHLAVNTMFASNYSRRAIASSLSTKYTRLRGSISKFIDFMRKKGVFSAVNRFIFTVENH
jgi:hypothetical protein